jgi:2-dehydro-3-deoxyphosphogluconate aldolase / (4S)-4-hydroxy-2-oxoglutarate aldolase
VSFVENASCFSQARVIPVLTPLTIDSGVTVSRVLFEAGLRMQEITLRTGAGLETIAALRRELPELIVGAGTVLTPQQGEAAVKAGALFLVSPGLTGQLLQFAAHCDVPFMPGVATISEMMRVQALGCSVAKLFPAHLLGAAAFLRSLAGPLPAMKFCPTGGIDASLAPDYLQLANVLAVGGSWMAPEALIAQSRWRDIRHFAEQAAALG